MSVGLGIASASAEEAQERPEPKPKFRRIPRIQFIAALGDPTASSGTGADTWGLWEEDPGPRGVRLGSYEKLVKAGGKAPVRKKPCWCAAALCQPTCSPSHPDSPAFSKMISFKHTGRLAV